MARGIVGAVWITALLSPKAKAVIASGAGLMNNKPLHERDSYARLSTIWQKVFDAKDYASASRCRCIYDRAWARQDAKAARRSAAVAA